MSKENLETLKKTTEHDESIQEFLKETIQSYEKSLNEPFPIGLLPTTEEIKSGECIPIYQFHAFIAYPHEEDAELICRDIEIIPLKNITNYKEENQSLEYDKNKCLYEKTFKIKEEQIEYLNMLSHGESGFAKIAVPPRKWLEIQRKLNNQPQRKNGERDRALACLSLLQAIFCSHCPTKEEAQVYGWVFEEAAGALALGFDKVCNSVLAKFNEQDLIKALDASEERETQPVPRKEKKIL